MPLVLLALLLVVGSLLSDVFLTRDNLLNILWASSVLGIVALGQTILLITCNFDMSVAYLVGLAGIVIVLVQELGLVPSIVVGILVAGGGAGLLNGGLAVITRANPFLITLGTGMLMYALSLTLTQSSTLYSNIPSFATIGRGQLPGGIYYSVLLFLGLAVALELMLRRTRFGRSLFVVGINEQAGRLSGIPVARVKLGAFVLCALLAAAAGLVVASRNGSTVANVGVGMEFDSIIAAVLGGTSLFGGRGGTLRTVVGVLTLGVLNNLLILLNVTYDAQQIVKGSVFLLVVWADSVLRSK
jgi:ribose transport system permease protein